MQRLYQSNVQAECLGKRQINSWQPDGNTDEESEETDFTDTDEEAENKSILIIGGSIAGIVIFVLVLALVLVLTKRRTRPSTANQKDDNPIYGPRDTIYVDEVDR